MQTNKNKRTDRQKGHRPQFERNRKRILKTQQTCGICGYLVDKSLPFPHPLSATVDHIIPVSKGGHPSAIDNLQLAHHRCNLAKRDRFYLSDEKPKAIIRNDDLPLSIDWSRYRSDENGSNYDELEKEANELRAKGIVITARGLSKL